MAAVECLPSQQPVRLTDSGAMLTGLDAGMESWRPVEPGTFPLADGIPARVVRLRGYGNAINAVQAQAFVEAFMDYRQAAA